MGIGNFLSGLPVVGGLFDDSNEDAQAKIAQNQALYNNLQTPDLQWSNLVPQQFSSAGNYDPENAQASTVSEDPLTRSAQLSALSKMAGLADTGLSDVDQSNFAKAALLGNQAQSSGDAAALQNAQSRGVGGSGLEYAMREQAGQDAAQRSQAAGLDQAASAAQQRALYNQAYLSGLGNVRQQDYNTQATNAGILNNFNQYNTGNQNQAQAYNLQNQQQIGNSNVQQNNATQQYNQQGKLGVQQQNFGNQVTKIGGQAGGNTAAANADYAQGAANQSNRNSITGAIAAVAAPGLSTSFSNWYNKKPDGSAQ